MDLERDIDDHLGIDPDAPEEEAHDQEAPMPKVAKVDEEEDLGDDSKEDPHLREKPRRGATTEDQKPHDERDYWLNQANHEDKEPPKGDSGPERQETGRWESSDGSWGGLECVANGRQPERGRSRRQGA
ncbi:MAG: hypothetical protein HQL51_10520 [Magnetococcales bacterium]|nr:hypothetical protein [Magnetococcales bacterium]